MQPGQDYCETDEQLVMTDGTVDVRGMVAYCAALESDGCEKTLVWVKRLGCERSKRRH